MSISRTIKVKNGDCLEDFIYYKCDITGIEFPEDFGYYGNDNVHISEEGIEVLFEDWISRKDKYSVPMILTYMEARFAKRYKPDRYISKEMRKIVLEKYEHSCVLCGATDKLEIDHIKPVSKRGISELSNLQVLCKKCNIKKSNKIIN